MALDFLRSLKKQIAGIQHPALRKLLMPARAAYRLARVAKLACNGTIDRQLALTSQLQGQLLNAEHRIALQQASLEQHQRVLVQLHPQHDEVVRRLGDIHDWQRLMDHRVLSLETRTAILEAHQSRQNNSNLVLESKTRHLENLHFDLFDWVDALKSRQELPSEMYQAFQDWKQSTPIPANPKVTVCIATYNRSKLLTTRSIPSVLNQTYKNLELIVVGDGCTDDTEEQIQKIADERLKFVNLSQRGQYPQDRQRRWMVAGSVPMNHALSLATGDYITHLDDDDEFLKDRLEKLVRFAAETQADFIWHPFFRETEPNIWQLHEASDFRYAQVTTSSIFYRSWFKQIPWDLEAHLLLEPGDWNRLRKIKSLGVVAKRFPEPLLRHYVERNQPVGANQETSKKAA